MKQDEDAENLAQMWTPKEFVISWCILQPIDNIHLQNDLGEEDRSCISDEYFAPAKVPRLDHPTQGHIKLRMEHRRRLKPGSRTRGQ